jgi:hypothetical protein
VGGRRGSAVPEAGAVGDRAARWGRRREGEKENKKTLIGEFLVANFNYQFYFT